MDPPPPQPTFPPLPTATFTTVPGDFSTITTETATKSSGAGLSVEVPNNNHIAHAANATPTLTQSFNHPSYADMIFAAITALKERDGSSKRAIAKYIEKAYTGLPPTHSALLTHHLKRLKSSGLLVMAKKSYMLPRSDASNDIQSQSEPNPVAGSGASSLTGPKRGRGRPPKPKSISISLIDSIAGAVQPIEQPNYPANTPSPVMVPLGLSLSIQPNVPAPPPSIQSNVAAAPSIQPNLAEYPPNAAAAAQLQADAVKRGPGRPKKVAGQGTPLVAKGRGRPPKIMSIGAKKSPGRPKKPKSVAANGVKKAPKRLPMSVVVPYATGAAVLNVPRPRGRPKKPPVLAAAGGVVVVPTKRPGRPPKVGGVVKPNKRPGRPVGRPKKQSRVKQAVGVLKPQVTSETANSAVVAIQELEGLASMDINVPLRKEAQPPHIQN
ncbi:hypothetical protein P3X46_004418 [Hevea brasiliensis]|uniref:H15 domain-containing protein n=1 Tax=Hevea brasiliensis TaxID=3981 RepID=A0ABQ9N0A8_HEVBR|nr:histone H1 isoform X2 [Hevea brasiliensis]KAJ9184718.1 hypothetical protein P3X46_004418 [Hevea brasiliensis]